MAYEIHLERIDNNNTSNKNPITLSEWKTAIEKLENVRLASNDNVMTNPISGDVIRIPNSGSNAEVFSLTELKWILVYCWNRGRISFKGLPSFFENPNDEIRQTTRLLASILDAKIVGDEGEFYD
jgi:hypothetical protein